MAHPSTEAMLGFQGRAIICNVRGPSSGSVCAECLTQTQQVDVGGRRHGMRFCGKANCGLARNFGRTKQARDEMGRLAHSKNEAREQKGPKRNVWWSYQSIARVAAGGES
jgi:hypothetical protein